MPEGLRTFSLRLGWSLVFCLSCGKSRGSEPDRTGAGGNGSHSHQPGSEGISASRNTGPTQLPHATPGHTRCWWAYGAVILHSAANRLLLCQRALLLEKLLLPGREERQVGVDHAIPSSVDQSKAPAPWLLLRERVRLKTAECSGTPSSVLSFVLRALSSL